MLRLMGKWLRGILRASMPRDIFEFWDGRHFRRVDPMVVCRNLDEHKEFDANTHPDLLDSGDDESLQVTVSAVREAFGLPVYDGDNGLTESECVELLTDFWVWSADLKKKRSTSPTSPEPMDQTSSEQSTTPLNTDSGSTSAEAEGETAGT